MLKRDLDLLSSLNVTVMSVEDASLTSTHDDRTKTTPSCCCCSSDWCRAVR